MHIISFNRKVQEWESVFAKNFSDRDFLFYYTE